MAAKKLKTRQVNNHILDVVTPMAIEFHTSDFWFGENMARIILVTKYPPRVKIGWLSRVANMDGVTCSVHLTPTDPAKLIENISKSIGELGGKINAGGSALMMERAEQQYNDAKKLLKKIDQEQENVFYAAIAIMITATDKDELIRKSKKVESALSGSSMKGRTAMFKQEDGLLAVSPYGVCPESIKEISNRNMPVSTIAGAYPFNISGLNDGTGFVFGKDSKGSLILLNTWARATADGQFQDRTNSNWTILGPPGSGKSSLVKHIFLNEWSQGTKIIIIDPEREYKDMCENLNGQWINCGGGRGGRINPLQVKDVPKDADDEETDALLYKDEGKGMGALALHFQTLRTFFKLYIKDLVSREYALLEEVLEELYASKQITWDTDISTIPNEQFPILEELYDLTLAKSLNEEFTEKKRERYEDLASLLRSCAKGADAALWNGHSTIEAKSNFIVLDTFDLQEADESIQRTQYFNILTWVWQQISHDRDEKKLLGIDEAYLIVDPDVPNAIKFVRNVSKRIRKYLGGLAVIAHSAVDFLDPAVKRYGQALLDNPCYKMFMGADGKDLEELTKLMKLTEAEQEMLAKKKQRQGLLIAGSKRLHAIVKIADFELQLFGKGGGK